jgi:hypothetical protein
MDSAERVFYSNQRRRARMNPVNFVLRVMQAAFVVSVLLFYYVISMIHPAAQAVNVSMQNAIVLCAIASALMGFIVQRMMLRNPSRSIPEKQSSILFSRWFAGHILRFATSESVALFGVVLHSLGSSSALVNALFISSLLLLLIWQPGTCPPEN